MNMESDFNEYQDPIATSNGETAKKKMSGSTVAATVVSFLLVFLFGVIGGLICYGGYWAVRAIALSKLPLAARIILSIIVGAFFLVLLFLFILFSASIQAGF